MGTCAILTVTLLLVGANLAKERFLDSTTGSGGGHPTLRLKLLDSNDVVTSASLKADNGGDAVAAGALQAITI